MNSTQSGVGNIVTLGYFFLVGGMFPKQFCKWGEDTDLKKRL